MGNEESFPIEANIISASAVENRKSKSDLIKTKVSNNTDRQMSIGILQKLPIFSHSSDKESKDITEDCSLSSGDMVSEDSPVTPPGPDLSHLSDTEREHIAHVIARAKQIERDEDERIREIENELNFIEEAASSRGSRHSISPDGSHCEICSKQILSGDTAASQKCVNCGRKVCAECGIFTSDPGATFADFLCSICQKKRYLVLSSGMWFHGLCHAPFPKTLSIQDLLQSPKKPKIERTASYSQYEDMLEKPKHDEIDELQPKRTSLPCVKSRTSQFLHNSNPEMRNSDSSEERDLTDVDCFNGSHQQQINPDYQEVKNRYLQESNVAKAKSRRGYTHVQSQPTKDDLALESPDEYNRAQDVLSFTVPPYANYYQEKPEIIGPYNYQSDDNYDFPLVEDIIDSDSSSGREEYETFRNRKEDNVPYQESDFPSVDDVLEENVSPEDMIVENSMDNDREAKQSQYFTYSNTTFKPTNSFPPEELKDTNYDPYDRHNSLMGYYEQYDNQFEDYFYSEEEFRAIENFQLYNNELIRRSMNEDEYYRQIDQSDTDSDIAKFAASIANDTANLTSQTVNLDDELCGYRESDTFKAPEEPKQACFFQTYTSNLLSTEHYQFKKSILSPIQDLSPNSSRADDGKPNDTIEEALSQAETCALKCDHDSDEECPWCYKDSTSINSQERNSSLSLSSSSLSSKISSTSPSLSSNGTLNNKSKSQLKRCQNYENISGLSESASADTLEDNNLIQELNNDNNDDDETEFIKDQESLDAMPNNYEPNKVDNHSSAQNAKNLCSQTSFESETNEYDELCQTMSDTVPFYANSTYEHKDRNFYDEPVLGREAQINTTSQHQTQDLRFSARDTELLKRETTDSRQNNFSAPIDIVVENRPSSSAIQFPSTLTTVKNFPPITEYYGTGKDTLLDRLCVLLQVPVQIKQRKSLLNEEIRLVTQLRRKHLNDFVQIQNVELQLNQLRNIEKQQMTEIQEKLAEIQNVKCGLTYPQYGKSRLVPNYQDLNYYYYYPQRNYYRAPYAGYPPPQFHSNLYNYPGYKYDQNFDDQRSSYSIHSSPQYLNYGGSYPKELKYNTQYYIDPAQNHPRGYSRSTDQIAMYNYQNYPMELSHSDQGLVNMGYNYPMKVKEQVPYNIDIELMQKEQRVFELEREIELRKRQIEETIRYQEELLHLAELNNVAVADYNNAYHQSANDQMLEFDQMNDYYLNEKGQHMRQYPDDNNFYPYDNLPMNPISQQQYASYYENMYQQTDPRDNVLYTEPVFVTDQYAQQRQGTKCDPGNYYSAEVANILEQHQQLTGKYPSNVYQRFDGQNQDQIGYSVAQDTEADRGQGNRNNSKMVSSRPLSGEYENVNENDADFIDSRPKQESSSRATIKTSKVIPFNKKDVEKPNKHYTFPTKRLLLMRDSKEKNLRGNGVGMRIIGGQLCSDGHLGAFVEEIFPGSVADRLQDQIKEGDELIEWNGVPLIGKTFEDVRAILRSDSDEIEILVRVGSISKSTETSKGNSDASEPNAAKSLTSVYDNMNIREPIEQTTVKKHPKFADESSNFRDTPSERRSQSIKRQKAQEYDMALASRSSPKVPSPTKDAAPSNKDIDCGSPTTAKRESPSIPTALARQRLNSKDITTSKSDTEKEDQDIEKEDSASEKLLGSIQLIISFDDYDQSLTVHVAKAKHLLPMDLNGLSDPFVKIRLHPDPTEDPDYNRQTRYMPNTLFPEWQQTMVFMNILKRSLKKRVLDISVWDFDRLKANDFMGQALISLANKAALDGKPHWYKLTELKEVDIPGLRMPSRPGTDAKTSTSKTKLDSKSSKEIKNPKDDVKASVPATVPTATTSSFSPNMPKYSSTVAVPNKLPEIKITKSIESSSPQTNVNNFRPARNPAITIMSEKSNNLVRADTADSKSSNSSSVTTDFLSEEQREIVRKWLGPGQLLMLSYTQRVDKVGNLPDDSLVVAELFMSLRKIADENTLIVSTASLINLKSKNTTEIYIKLYLMYSEQQLSRVMKRKTRPLLLAETNNFNQTFTFNTPLEGMLLQVSLWSCGKGLTVHKMFGEAVIHLDDIEFVKKNSKKDVSGWYKLLKPDI